VQQLSVKLYEQMAQEQQAEGEGSEASGEDDVVDADYQEVDDDKDPADENKKNYLSLDILKVKVRLTLTSTFLTDESISRSMLGNKIRVLNATINFICYTF